MYSFTFYSLEYTLHTKKNHSTMTMVHFLNMNCVNLHLYYSELLRVAIHCKFQLLLIESKEVQVELRWVCNY